MRKISLVAACVIVLSGCAAGYQTQGLSGGTPLDPEKSVYVAVPPDGGYGDRPALGSGQQVAQALAAALARRGIQTHLGVAGEEASAAATAAGAGYLAQPTVANWEARATEWSGRPSRLSVAVRVLTVPSGEVVDSSVLQARSRIVSFTSTSPAALLEGTMSRYASRLYGQPAATASAEKAAQ